MQELGIENLGCVMRSLYSLILNRLAFLPITNTVSAVGINLYVIKKHREENENSRKFTPPKGSQSMQPLGSCCFPRSSLSLGGISVGFGLGPEG